MAALDKYFNSEEVSDVETNKFVVLIPKHTAYMQVTYLMIDPHSRTILPKAKHLKWPRLTDLLDFRVVVLKNCIYVIGGREKTSGKCIRQTLKYDPFVGRWRDSANLKKPRCRHTATVMNGKIYVVGGESTEGEVLDSCEEYEPLVDEWHKAEKLLGPRKDHVCVAKEDKIYLSGGTSKTESVNDNIWVLKKHWPSRNKPEEFFYDWFPFKDLYQRTMSVRLAKHNMEVNRGKIYFMAGIKKNPAKESMSLSPSHSKSRKKRKAFTTAKGLEAYKVPSRFSRDVKLAELNANMTSSTEKVTMWNDKITDSQVLFMEGLPPEKRRWLTDLPHSTIARCSAASVVVGNKIYLLGGHTIEDESVSVNTVQYYHCKKEKWVDAFSLGEAGDFHNVDAAIINVPATNKDFQPVSYGDCKWVLW